LKKYKLMTRTRYLLRSLKYYYKQHLALLLGTIISTAVLTGALIIGDTVSHSLKSLADKRLGPIDYALQSGERFITDGLTKRLTGLVDIRASSILHLQSTIIEPDQDIRIHSAQIFGVDSSFLFFSNYTIGKFEGDGAMISENVARRLNINPGQEILIKVRNVDAIPVQTPFSVEKAPTISIRLPVSKILNDEEFGRFSLLSDQKAPYNVFVNKTLLQAQCNLKGRSNLLIIDADEEVISADDLNEALRHAFLPEDASLRMDTLSGGQMIEISSDRIFIDQSIQESFEKLGADKMLTYLVNAINMDGKSTPYSFVSGLRPARLPYPLNDDEVILNRWCADDLNARPGDTVLLEYFTIGPYRQLETRKKAFVVKGVEATEGPLFRKDLMPQFPGLSDAESCSEWNTGIPIDLDRIRDKDEDYWENYRGTPKVILRYDIAAELWGNVYGKSTAMRIPSSETKKIHDYFGELVAPLELGLVISDVRQSGLDAAANGVDFGELFLSLSFFVIVSGILLIILLYSLNLLSRRQEIERLSALGFSRLSVFRIFFSEILVTVIAGNLLGVFLGIGYNSLILKGLNGLWQDAVRTNALEVYVYPRTLAIGFIAGTLIALLTVYFILRQNLRRKTQLQQIISTPKKSRTIWYLIAWILFGSSILYLVYSIVVGHFTASSSFMAMGAVLIISLLIFYWLYLGRVASNQPKAPTVHLLAISYLSRNRKRSILVISLLAFGIFSVLVTGMNRKTFYGTETENASGTGGYLYWMETAFPLVADPGSEKGKELYGFEDETLVDSLEFLPLLTIGGDDASCLNLNQVQNPTLLGIDPSLPSKRGSFSFTTLIEEDASEDPWMALENEYAEGVIPAFVDQTVITWGLMKSVGDTLLYQDEFGDDLNVIIAGGLGNTIFQGNVLISQDNMLKYFPSVPGAKICLIDGDPEKAKEISALIDRYFQDYGVDYSTSYARLDEFNSVNNTYLNVFLVLGALGLLIGTVGFGIVLYRNRVERRSERAMMAALGIKASQIKAMLRREHLILLFSGTLIAIAGTTVASIPSLMSAAFSMPYLFIIGVLGLIVLSGLFWIYLFSGWGDRENVISFLRKE
jgi:ABC-type lipoprotein release transport system permease subunit